MLLFKALISGNINVVWSAIQDPGQQKMLYQYDTEGCLARQTDRNGKVIEYAYNFNDRLIKRREMSSGMEESYMYREDGLLQTATNEHTRYDYTYNEDGLLTGNRESVLLCKYVQYLG
ncbi:hypothetical protein [Paenibacillus sp. BJ-4]|uniref:hypothetical protein n=1 Tax=Paenibacillus sp. BJ-4 TaxID=2878097 RepID=UPI001CF0293F|nr:hypothetical protein [Paenibacillus sp. BJ-4]